MAELKRIFIVDGNLEIIPVKILKSDWKSKIFAAKIDGFPVIVLKHAWSRITTYAGFATKKGAEDFKIAIQKLDKQRQREECQTKKG